MGLVLYSNKGDRARCSGPLGNWTPPLWHYNGETMRRWWKAFWRWYPWAYRATFVGLLLMAADAGFIALLYFGLGIRGIEIRPLALLMFSFAWLVWHYRYTRPLLDDWLNGTPRCIRCRAPIRLYCEPHESCSQCGSLIVPSLKCMEGFAGTRLWGLARIPGYTARFVLWASLGFFGGLTLLLLMPPGQFKSPLVAVLLGTGLFVFAWGFRGNQRRSRQFHQLVLDGEEYCWKCLYRIDALPDDATRCPECGTLLEISRKLMQRWAERMNDTGSQWSWRNRQRNSRDESK